MKTFTQTSSALFSAALFTFARAEAHAHAHSHEVRSGADVLPALEMDAAPLEARDEDSYRGKSDHSEKGSWNGGSYQYKGYGSDDSEGSYGSGGKGKSTSTMIVIKTEKAAHGMSTVTAAGEHGSTLMQTMTLSAVESSASASMGNGQQSGQAAVQLSYITTTVFQSAAAQTVTVTPMPQIITQTQMVTVTEAGTCSTTGLATGAAGAANLASIMSSVSQMTEPAMSVTSAVTSAMSVPTSILTAPPMSMASVSVGASGQVVQGMGVFNPDGDCSCECLCAVGSFPSYSAMAAASPTATMPTTMQTIASSVAAQSMMSAATLSTGTSSMASAMTSSSVSSASMAGTTMSMSSSSTTASSDVVFTLNASASSSTSAMSSPPETATSSQSSMMSSTAAATPVSAPSILAPDSASITVLPTQSAAAGFSIDVNTLSLSSQLVLGNLAAQATPGA